MSSSPLHRLLALAAALVALAIAAPAASADSIAYVKGGDVWLSTGDGPASTGSPRPAATRTSRRPTTGR